MARYFGLIREENKYTVPTLKTEIDSCALYTE